MGDSFEFTFVAFVLHIFQYYRNASESSTGKKNITCAWLES